MNIWRLQYVIRQTQRFTLLVDQNYPQTKPTSTQSTGTSDRAKAQEYHGKLKASLWDQERLGVRLRHSWNEAVVRYLAETTHKASQVSDKFHLCWLDKFLNGADLATIKRDLLDRIMAARIAEGVANSSVNRVMEVVRAILRKAANEWEWLDRAPSLRMLPEPKRRVRFLTQSEADRPITTLPEHLAAMVRFSLETGLRREQGWESPEMVRRYAHFSADHLAPYADRLCELSVVGVGTVPTKVPTDAQMERAYISVSP